jgi:hypothetical protein
MNLPTRKRHTKSPTNLPKEFLNSVSTLFKEQFGEKLTGESFLVYGALYTSEVLLGISLSHPKTLRAGTMVTSMDMSEDVGEKPEKVTEQLKVMVDVSASWFAQCFETGKGLEAVLDEMADVDTTWQELEWEKSHLFVKLGRENFALERAADDLLRKAGFDPNDDEDEDAMLDEILNEDDNHGGFRH